MSLLTTRAGLSNNGSGGLILYLDAGKTASYPGTGTTWTDLSQKQTNGTLTNGPTYLSNVGGEIVFDGTDDYVSCGTGSNVNLTAGTFAAWIRTTDITSNNRVFMAYGGDGSSDKGIVLGSVTSSGGNLKFSILNSTQTILLVPSATSVPYVNQYFHFAGTFDSSNLKLYLNGVLATSSANTVGAVGSSNTLWIGGEFARSYYLSGSVISAQVYNRALASSEILRLYNSGKSKVSLGIATGGAFTIAGGYNIHTFTSSSNLVVTGGNLVNAEWMLIGGGAGGGKDNGGGGGAADVVTGTGTFGQGTFAVVIGGGGSGSASSASKGVNGTNSTVIHLTSTGGGGGGSSSNANGGNGGCGGGGRGNGSATGGTSSSGLGFAGGAGTGALSGGGGGGAGQAGNVSKNTGTGGGGNGFTSSITGTSVTYAGGGGGSVDSGSVCPGGTGGGGTGGFAPGPTNGGAGTVNTGSGGGGGPNNAAGGAGGSGYFVIRYPSSASFGAEYTAFIGATGISDSTQQNAIAYLIGTLKQCNIWSKMYALYPMIGGSAATHKFNLVNPADTDAAFRLNFAGGWTHSSTGALPNGSTGYADTFFIPSAQLNTTDLVSVGYYSRTSTVKANELPIGTNDGTRFLNLRIRGTSNERVFDATFPSGAAYRYAQDFSSASGAGFFCGSTTSTRTSLYVNGSEVVANTNATVLGLCTVKTFIGAANLSGSASGFTDKECALAYISKGLTATESALLYSIVQNYQMLLSRNV